MTSQGSLELNKKKILQSPTYARIDVETEYIYLRTSARVALAGLLQVTDKTREVEYPHYICNKNYNRTLTFRFQILDADADEETKIGSAGPASMRLLISVLGGTAQVPNPRTQTI